MVTSGNFPSVGSFCDRRGLASSQLIHPFSIEATKPFENSHVTDEVGSYEAGSLHSVSSMTFLGRTWKGVRWNLLLREAAAPAAE